MLPQSKLFWALEASAGTGKTFNLAVRFIELILSGAEISQIMALTFTKKAANEMKERIIRNFLNLENQKNELELIKKDLNLNENEIISLRDKRKDEFLKANLNISTFDSFFNKIIKLFALNCGVDPHFGIDDTILKHQQKIFIDEIIKNPQDFVNLINLIANLDAKKDKILANLDYLQENQVEIPNFTNPKFPNLNSINLLLDEILEFLKKGEFSQKAIGIFDKDRKISEIMKISVLNRETLAEHSFFKKAYTPELDEKFIALKDEIKKYLDELEIYNLSELAKFIKTYKNAKTKFNKMSARLTYSDVSSLVYDLLCGGKIDTNLLYFRLDSKITHLLIDEFQDTSVSQYKIMHPLISEIVAGAGQNGIGSFFYVGDKKQSIYGFRGAKKELFDALRDEFLQIRTTNLDTNYRSLKLLVKFVNFVFKDKFDGKFVEQKCNNALNGSDLVKSQEYIKNNPNFSLFEIENDDYGYVKSLSSDEIFDEVLNQIAFLRQNGVDDGDITVLCWKNEDCESLKEMLESKGIGVTINSTKKLRSVKEIASIVEYAKFCLSGAKIYERNLNSLLGFTPERENLDFRQNPQILAKKIAKILKIELNNENILLFFEVLSKYKNFIEYIYANDDTNAFSQSSSGVNLMSIHKSKGLEFDHLIVCDLVGGKKHNADNFLINYDTNAKKWQIKYKVSGRENVDSRYSNLKEKLEKIEKDEKINDIYVAFTRAKKSLIIIKKAKPNGKSPSYFVPYETGSGNNKVLHDDYLDLGDFEYGFVIPSAPKAITKSAPQKIVFDESIPKQLVSDNESDIDENGESITNYKSQIFGTTLHYTLEMCEKFDENSLKIALMASKNKFGQFLGIESFENIEKRILNLINSHKFSELLSGAKIYKEVPFKTQDGEFRQIDLLLVKENEGIIVDYKSSKNDEFFEKNRGQVEFYKSSLNQIYPNLQFRGFIVILNHNKTEFYEI
ncbi:MULTISPECIES: RecB-like helicase [unclassified Campylobacter]|uniref:RecB-like helicase n=1 Tax=unclassified Campylobacter TaxID=2593542 RepID=UPI0022E9AE6E|nr:MULTISPECIES: RecB-like helicase [unclassified Campylobacter]MDA3056085.1 RecB-like helicase [Campylobacter sp. CN_NA1]MDA3065230.1 RecB-like helicase [Campylobacter sp. CN_NE4]MDA3068055.1 RecB-like helicase [Campylobacter sp. CN_NE3]MDA3082683.1 RecB-like helicase [Campylobacter sp. CN_EL2]MDA3083578.1 RecB-like helicase [Campylobacter sp. CN_NE1]